MFTVSVRVRTNDLLAAFKATGTTPPAKLNKALDRFATTPDRIDHLYVPPDALAAAVLTALDAGKDPANDTTVQRHIAAAALGNPGLKSNVMAIVEDQTRDTISALADQIVTLWRKPFDTAAADLVAAHDILGDVALDNTETIVRNGASATAAWASATTAVAMLTAIDAGWRALRDLAGGHVDKRTRLLRYTTADYDTVLTDMQGNFDATPWGCARAGLTFSLPTGEEYRQRVLDWNHEQERRADAWRNQAAEVDKLPRADRDGMLAALATLARR